MKKFVNLAAGILGVIICLSVPGFAQTKRDDCTTLSFRYLVLADEQRSAAIRHIDVFLDEKAFSEENLKKLFAYLSPKYPATRLVIQVVTNWNQIPLPSDCPPVARSSMPDAPDLYDYHQAVYYNVPEGEYFRYNPVKKIHSSDFKTVFLKRRK